MSDVNEEIQSYLDSNGTDPKLSLDVALQFSRAMCTELCAALGEWERAVAALEQMKSEAAAVN